MHRLGRKFLTLAAVVSCLSVVAASSQSPSATPQTSQRPIGLPEGSQVDVPVVRDSSGRIVPGKNDAAPAAVPETPVVVRELAPAARPPDAVSPKAGVIPKTPQASATAKPSDGARKAPSQAPRVAAYPAAASIPRDALLRADCDLSRTAQSLDDAPSGSWIELANSQMRNILLKRDDPLVTRGVWGTSGSAAVITAWNSGAFDGCNWYFVGGGHSDYGGNEVYAFDVASAHWSRLTDPTPYKPSSPTNQCPGIADTRFPVPAHAYDGLIYSPLTKSLFLWSSAIFCDTNDTYAGAVAQNPATGVNEVWEFVPATREWRWLHPAPPPDYYPKTAIDPITGVVVYCKKHGCRIFDPVRRNYSEINQTPGFRGWMSFGNATVDSKRRQVVMLGESQIIVGRINDLAVEPLRLVKETLALGDLRTYGIAYDEKRDMYALWSGNREVYKVNPETWDITLDASSGKNVPVSATRGVYGRWAYVPRLDAFMGMDNVDQGFWLYRLSDDGKPVVEIELRTCHPNGKCSIYPTLQEALDKAIPGDAVILPAGEYRQSAIVRVPNITIRGETGTAGERAHLVGSVYGDKAALVIDAPNITIENIECSMIDVSDGNGACLRLQQPDVTIRNVYFHDNQQGILGGTGGKVVIENSVFERNGNIGRAHGVYISGDVQLLEFIGNSVLSTRGFGHGLKSRALRNVIRNNVIAGLDGDDSRAIDIPNGGEIVIADNILQKGPRSDNTDMIGIAREVSKGLHKTNETLIENNVIIFDIPKRGVVITSSSPTPVILRDNTVVGAATTGDGVRPGDKNRFYSDRRSAGLPAFPHLPAKP